jgi:RNA ligase
MNELYPQLLQRDGPACALCECQETRIYFLLDPSLWDECGELSENAVLLCDKHYDSCFATDIDIETIRERVCLSPCLPPQLYAVQRYDRWGNPVLRDGRRAKGELFFRPDTQSALARAGKLTLFTEWVKYPRTYLVPWSEEVSGGDRMLDSVAQFSGSRVVATEKMDGENMTLYRDFFHSRSVESNSHFSRRCMEEIWQRVRHAIPVGWRICGEYLYAAHTVRYDDLASYFLGFSVWNQENVCLSWDRTLEFLRERDIATVPVLFDGLFDSVGVHQGWLNGSSARSEGYVLRSACEIEYVRFRALVGKFVRAGYRQSEPIRRNLETNVPITCNLLAQHRE